MTELRSLSTGRTHARVPRQQRRRPPSGVPTQLARPAATVLPLPTRRLGPAAPAVRPTRSHLLGLAVDAMTMDEVLERLHDSLESRARTTVGVVNAAKVVNLRSDTALRDSLLRCDLLLADGQSVVWASRVLGVPIPERVAGIDLFERLLDLAHVEGRSVYLLGAKPDVLARLCEHIAEHWPGLRLAGARDGYFSDEEGPDVARDIADSHADMLFIGMTSPKKEIFLDVYGDQLKIPVQHGVGGSFDVLAGVVRRAPEMWQRLGMEWAFRVVQEPRRLWKRYLTTNTTFLVLLARERAAQVRTTSRHRTT
jgi:N-acetylglucosaminyldiphosphoundecaprenol N-acetyl-beta-D-mannosaminyltransferase